ncbi:MAG: hypothetical protein ACK55I_13635, partial [bacterium]
DGSIPSPATVVFVFLFIAIYSSSDLRNVKSNPTQNSADNRTNTVASLWVNAMTEPTPAKIAAKDHNAYADWRFEKPLRINRCDK